MPAMQPAKPWAASKNAALASVTSTPALQQRRRHLLGARRRLTLVEQRDRTARPHRPVAEQAADDPALDRHAVAREPERRHQIAHDGVVVAGVERDVVAARVDDGADDVERLIAVERRDLDGDDAGNLGEAAPEGVGQHAAADRRLQVEADERNACADRLAVRDERRVVRIRERREAEESRVIAEPRQQVGFAQRLIGRAADTADADERLATPRVRAIHLLARDRQHRLEEADRGIANRELRRVHADGQAAGPAAT